MQGQHQNEKKTSIEDTAKNIRQSSLDMDIPDSSANASAPFLMDTASLSRI
jgi:hypothetical protein